MTDELDGFLHAISVPALEDVQGQSDRVAAIVLTSMIDDLLTNAIITRLIQNKRITKRLFTGIGPMAPLFPRIDMGYLLGIYDEEQRKALHSMREMRNRFAHTSGPIDFKSEDVTKFAEGLKFFEMFCKDKTDLREVFLAAAHFFLGMFLHSLFDSSRKSDAKPHTSPDKSAPPPAQQAHAPSQDRKKRRRQPRPSRA